GVDEGASCEAGRVRVRRPRCQVSRRLQEPAGEIGGAQSEVSHMHSRGKAPILEEKRHSAPSAFRPENLLGEARGQKGLPESSVPQVCVLDPDGDMVRQLARDGRAKRDPAWACYHTDLYRLPEGAPELGVIGCAVGAPFAVLVAEE